MSRITKWIFPILFFVILLFIVEFILQNAKIPDYIIPLPSQVVNVIISDWEIILQNTITTSIEWLLGISLAIILGFIL